MSAALAAPTSPSHVAPPTAGGDAPRRLAAGWALASAALLLGAAGLQLAASLQRWGAAADAWARSDISIEDHRFDYSFPADPWENLGIAAQLHGAGLLLLALGVIALQRAASRPGDGLGRVLALVIAGAFGLGGVHALVSGLLGMPSPLQYLPITLFTGALALVGLLVLAVRVARRSWATALACALLLGSTLPGQLVATFVVAPAIAGYQSHDTTPWTETIVAVTVGAAGLAMLAAAAISAVAARRVRP